MDILSILLARAMTPQGKTEIYVAKANAAATKAEKAQQDAASAIALVESAADEVATAKEEASDLLEAAQDALETAQAAQINLPETYSTTGQNTDGYMTQKATTDALAAKADASSLSVYVTTSTLTNALASKANTSDLAAKADKTYVDQQIAAIPAGDGSGGNITINFDPEDANHLVKIDENGHLVASQTTEESIIEALLRAGTYDAKHAVGLDIDYANRAFTRTQGAIGKSMGSDFNSYLMYGGRTRCNVADDGTINAFYGDPSYTEDGSNGMVMIYQPKFYYKRIIRVAEELLKGRVVRHEALLLSDIAQSGFKLAPIFNGDLDYVLLPAFDASLVNDKLASIGGVKPLTQTSIGQMEAYANARGDGWHIMNMAAESANQMLEMVEFGTMNGQAAIEQGITYAPSGNNIFFITGSTAALGNGTGHAESTNVEINGSIQTKTENGYRAISYRGMENPWGNLWSMIGGTNIVGNGSQDGGTVSICSDFNYTPGINGANYHDIGFNLPSTYGWINAMGIGDENYDWVYVPVECSNSANSAAPVGDEIWTAGKLNHSVVFATGGSYGQKDSCGPFYYAADRQVSDSARYNYGAKLLYIPTKNATYTANITKWNTYMGE